MLLVLQVRKTEVNEAGSADEKMLTQVEAQLLRSQIDSLESKKTSLENSLELQTDMNSQLGDPLKQAIAGELDSLMKGISSLRSEAAALESELQAASNEARATQADMQNRTQQAISLKEQIKAVREELEAQKELRTRTMDLPKEQVTSKGMNPVIINEDGLYNVDAGGETGLTTSSSKAGNCSTPTSFGTAFPMT
jgi:chromosome segregation ATPase